jgi:hypothetical protein
MGMLGSRVGYLVFFLLLIAFRYVFLRSSLRSIGKGLVL